MNHNRLVGLSLFLVAIALAFGWTAGKSNADEGLEQRVSGLEARVSILETQVADVSSGSSEENRPSETYTITVIVLAKPTEKDGVGLWDEETGVCFISDEFQTGATFSALNEDGKVIATSELVSSEAESHTKRFIDSCLFETTIEVPEFEFLTLTFGDLETDPYSFEELKEDDWIIQLTSRS